MNRGRNEGRSPALLGKHQEEVRTHTGANCRENVTAARGPGQNSRREGPVSSGAQRQPGSPRPQQPGCPLLNEALLQRNIMTPPFPPAFPTELLPDILCLIASSRHSPSKLQTHQAPERFQPSTSGNSSPLSLPTQT